MQRKISLFAFPLIFLFFSCFYLHILIQGYETDVPQHIALALIPNLETTKIPHPIFSILLKNTAALMNFLNPGEIIDHLGVSTDNMQSRFSEEFLVIMVKINPSSTTVPAVTLPLLVHFHIAAALLMALFVTLNAYLLYLLLGVLLQDTPFPVWARIGTVMMLLVITPIYLPFFNKNFVMGQGSPNVWHNSTYLIMKSFSYISLLLFISATKGKQHKKLKFILLSCFLVLSAFAKPSFLLVFLPSLLIYSVIRAPRNFREHLKVLSISAPALAVLVYQYLIVFNINSDSNVIIDPFGVWKLYSRNIPVSILSTLCFPLTVFFFLQQRRVPSAVGYHIAWIMVVVSILQSALLAESGKRYDDANFFWGMNISLDILFIYSLAEFIRWSKVTISQHRTSKKNVLLFCAGSVILMLHVLSGIVYIFKIYRGKGYF